MFTISSCFAKRVIIPSAKDLQDKIEKFMDLYKMRDLDRIEKCLMHHLTVKNQKMIYYILREKQNGKSDLSADYDNFEEIKSQKVVEHYL